MFFQFNLDTNSGFPFQDATSGSISDTILQSFDFLRVISESNTILFVKIISVIISIIFIAIILKKLYQIQEILHPKPIFAPAGGIYPSQPQRRTYNDEFAQIKNYVESDLSTEWKIAVLEADKIMDDALINIGTTGETMGERLKNMNKKVMPSLDLVWEAHKLRNDIAHDINVSVSQEASARAVASFERALREIGALI